MDGGQLFGVFSFLFPPEWNSKAAAGAYMAHYFFLEFPRESCEVDRTRPLGRLGRCLRGHSAELVRLSR